MPDVLRMNLDPTSPSGYGCVFDPRFPHTEYLKRSHVEATTVPKAEHEVGMKIQAATMQNAAALMIENEKLKADSVPRDKVDAVVRAYNKAMMENHDFPFVTTLDLDAAIRSLEDKG